MRFIPLFGSPILALGLCMMWAVTPAQAQPDINNAPKGENPPNWNPGGRPRNPGALNLRRYFPLAQLGEQRTEAIALSIKQRLTGAGFTDKALQTAVVNEFKTQEAARTALLAKWQKITQAMRAKQTPEAELGTMLKDFRETTAKEKARRVGAKATLETQFKISQKPALDALLMTLGITGDEADLVGQATNNGFTQVVPLAEGGPIGNLQPRYFTMPVIPKLEKRAAPPLLQPRYFVIPEGEGGATPDNQGQLLFPIPQPELPQLHLFDNPDNAMPNAAPPADAPRPEFF